MSKFYGTVVGMASTPATRRGGRDIKVAAQSWDGSVITRLYYNKDDELTVDLQIADGSSTMGRTIFTGSMEELESLLKGEKQ